MYTIKQLMEWNTFMRKGEQKIPARPINYRYESFRDRLYQSWLVLTRKADAFIWDKEVENGKR